MRILSWLAVLAIGMWAWGDFGEGYGTVAWGEAGDTCPAGATALYLDQHTGEALECTGGDPLGGFDEHEAVEITDKAQQLAGDADGLTVTDRDEVARFAAQLEGQ